MKANSTEDVFHTLYEPREEKTYFGKKFLFKGTHYPHCQRTLIAKTTNGDGHVIRVYVDAAPARFWTFEYDGKYEITTGSGDWMDYCKIYELLKKDMLGVGAVE